MNSGSLYTHTKAYKVLYGSEVLPATVSKLKKLEFSNPTKSEIFVRDSFE